MKLKNMKTFEEKTSELNISDVSDSNSSKKIVSDIKKDIEKLIEKHQLLADKEIDNDKKQFLMGCVAGLRRAILTLPLIETL
jgi:hypothetical protein